jgi:hypothetical protein
MTKTTASKLQAGMTVRLPKPYRYLNDWTPISRVEPDANSNTKGRVFLYGADGNLVSPFSISGKIKFEVQEAAR